MKTIQTQRNGIMIAINSSTRAAIDLASIMVGIIVIGIIGGVIAATVFAVIPWAQDNAAKQAIDSVSTAESAYRGFEADKADDIGLYADKNTLLTYTTPDGKSGLVQNAPTYLVEEAIDLNGDPCWAAVSKSGSGNYFYGTSKSVSKEPASSMNDVNGALETVCPVNFPDITDGTDGPGDNEVLPPGVAEGAYITATLAEDWNPFEAVTAPVGSADTQFPWAVGKNSGDYVLPTDVKLYVNDTTVPVNASIYWEVNYINPSSIQYWFNAPNMTADLDAAGFTLDEFLADGWIISNIDGVDNVMKLNIGDDEGNGGGGDNGGGNPTNPDISCGAYGYENFGDGSRSAGGTSIQSNGGYSCSYSFGARNYDQSEYQTDLGAPSVEESHNGCHWNYLGCMTDEDYAANGEVMWLNGAAEKKWYAENGTTVRYYYNEGGSDVNFYSPTANAQISNDDPTYNSELPNVYIGIGSDFSSYFGGGTFSNSCISDFNANPFTDHFYQYDMYESYDDFYACPEVTQDISIQASQVKEDTVALAVDFKKLAQNGGKVTFTTTQGYLATIIIAPNSWYNADPNEQPTAG